MSHILCFPFAIDANEEIINKIFKIIKDYNLFSKIISACISNELNYEVPIVLISRLILTDEDLYLMLINKIINNAQVILRFIILFLFNLNLISILVIRILYKHITS